MKKYFNYLIIGGGILGSVVSYSLFKRLETAKSNANVAVIDLDLEGEFSSTLKNAGGVRATWKNSVNIKFSNYSINFYEEIATVRVRFFMALFTSNCIYGFLCLV